MPDSVPSRMSTTARSGACSAAAASASLRFVVECTELARLRKPRSHARSQSSSSSTSNTVPHPTMPLTIVGLVHHVAPERQREPAIERGARLHVSRGNVRHAFAWKFSLSHCLRRSIPCGGLTPPALERTVSGVAGGLAGCGAPTIVIVWIPPPVLVNALPIVAGSNTVPCAVTYGCRVSAIAGSITDEVAV